MKTLILIVVCAVCGLGIAGKTVKTLKDSVRKTETALTVRK